MRQLIRRIEGPKPGMDVITRMGGSVCSARR
jgi:hypothetical protein